MVGVSCSVLLFAVSCWLFMLGGSAYFTGQTSTAGITIGGITYELPLPRLEFNAHHGGLFWRTVHWTLQVDKNGSMTLNGDDYGKVNPGNRVTVSWEGEVTVNGVKRMPQKGR